MDLFEKKWLLMAILFCLTGFVVDLKWLSIINIKNAVVGLGIPKWEVKRANLLLNECYGLILQ